MRVFIVESGKFRRLWEHVKEPLVTLVYFSTEGCFTLFYRVKKTLREISNSPAQEGVKYITEVWEEPVRELLGFSHWVHLFGCQQI